MSETTQSNQPKPVSRRVAIRLAASVLFERARIISTRTVNTALNRRGPEAATNAISKEHGRKEDIERFRQWAKLLQVAWQAKKVEGEGIDAAVLGYLLAVLDGDDNCIPELKAELLELDMIAPSDLSAVPGGPSGYPLWIRYILRVSVD